MKITLKALRTNYGLSQKEMAKVLGVSPDTMSNYENARTVPNKKVLDRIDDVFGVNYNDIIFSSHLRLNRNSVAE